MDFIKYENVGRIERAQASGIRQKLSLLAGSARKLTRSGLQLANHGLKSQNPLYLQVSYLPRFSLCTVFFIYPFGVMSLPQPS